MKTLHYLKTGPILISLLFLTACAENGPSSAYLSPKLTPDIEINDSGESVVELLPLTPPPSEDPIVQRLEEEIRLSRVARAEAKLAELKDERMSFSDPKVTFKHDGTKEVSLDVNYQGSTEPIIFLSPKEHGKHFMFLKHSGFEKRNVTLQGMCLDDTPETCNELALEVAYYVNDLKVTEQFTVEKPTPPAEDIEEETPPLKEEDIPTTTDDQDKAPELEFISETLENPKVEDESPSVDITTPQEDDPIHFISPQKLAEPAPHDELPHIDPSSPEPAQKNLPEEPSAVPPVVMSEAPQASNFSIISEDIDDLKTPSTDEPISFKQPVAISGPSQIDTLPIIDTTSHEDTEDVKHPAPNVMFVSPSLGAHPLVDNNLSAPVVSASPVIAEQPLSIISAPPARDTISPSVMSVPPERETPTLEDQTLTLNTPIVAASPKIAEPPTLTAGVTPDVLPDTPEEAPAAPVATTEEVGDLIFTAATETGSDLAPKTSPRRQAPPDNLIPTSPISLDVDGDSINVGAGRFVFPDIDGGAATTAFNVNSAEDYSLSLDSTSGNAMLTEIQTTVFNQSERFYSRHRGRYGKIVNSTQLDSRIPGAGVNPGRRGKQYASGLMTKTLQYTSETFGRRHPEAPICINDLSGRHGGRLGGHSSHQNGLDADISFPSTSNDCSGNPFKNWRVLDGPDDTFRQKNWEFLNILINTERVNTIFADRDFVRALCRHAKKPSTGTTKAERNKVFSKLRHENGHANHYHIRMTCNSQNVGCVTQELPGNITNCN